MGPPLGGLRGWAYRANIILHYNIKKMLWLSEVKYVFGKAFICNTASKRNVLSKSIWKQKKKKGDYGEEMEQ